MSQEQYKWSRKSLEELADFYLEEIHPRFQAEPGTDGRVYPTAKWMRERGFSGLRYALREHHDLSLSEFFEEAVGFSQDHGSSPDQRFDIQNEPTREAVDAYFSRREERGLLADSTLSSKRSRFARWVRVYKDVHESDALVPRASSADSKPVERERARRVMDKIAPELGTNRSRRTYVSDVRAVYSWLEDEGYIAFNPLSGIEEEYDWEVDEPDNLSLEARDVAALYDQADSPREQLLVIGLAGWGLRPSELAGLHVRQLMLEGDDPHISFDERKNGPGTVAIHYGREAAADRIDELGRDPDRDWNGYLFPSESSSSGHRATDTIRNRFTRLARDAGVAVGGGVPTPKMGRRYWYSTFSSAMADIMAEMDDIADQQGAESGLVVWNSYLDAADRRARRREKMETALGEAFGSTA